MPLTGAEYQTRSPEDILEFLIAEMRAEFGEDIDLTQSSAFRTFAEAISSVDGEEIEPALANIHDSAFLESSEGENLEKVVAILGISRRSAVHATGVIQFNHGETTDGNYTIRNGAIVQSDTDEPVEYETTEDVTLSLYDDFESASLDSDYQGDTEDFSLGDGSGSEPTPDEGSGLLIGPQTDGSKIYKGDTPTVRGSVMDFRTWLGTDAVVGNMFAVRTADDYYRTRIDQSGEHHIEIVTPSGATSLESNTGLTIPDSTWLRNEIEWDGEENGRIISRIYDDEVLVDEVEVLGENEIDDGGFGFESLDATAEKYWDHSGDRSVLANARAREGGGAGNVGGNALVTMPTVPNGVQSVTNPHPMGADGHYLNDLTEFSTGRAEETDEQLRSRAQVSEGDRGKATVPAIIAEMRSLPGAVSLSVFENKEDETVDGLPPHSFEVVYYGTDPDEDIAEAIFGVKGATAHDVGGVNGTETTHTVTADNGQTFTMHWSEPTELNVDMEIDIVVNDSFIGERDLREDVVDYVGGTAPDGTTVVGTGAGENVYVDQIEDIVTGPDETGVIGISSYSFTPSVTTDSNGLEVIDIADNEVAMTNGEDGSIVFNVTEV